MDFVGKGLHGGVGAHVEVPYFERAGWAGGRCLDVLHCCVSLVDVPAGEDDLRGSELDHPAAGFQTQARAGARDDDGLAVEGCGWGWWLMDELAVDESGEEGHVGQHSFLAEECVSIFQSHGYASKAGRE